MEKAQFKYYISRITEEDSFFALLEAGADVLPMLEDQFEQESSPERRASIIRVVWEHRNPRSLEFLALALSDPTPLIWQEALNGIVTIGGEEAEAVLRAALPNATPKKRDWIAEAITQI